MLGKKYKIIFHQTGTDLFGKSEQLVSSLTAIRYLDVVT